MKTIFTDTKHSRGHEDILILIPLTGECQLFKGSPIPQICHCQVVGGTKKGRWSDTTWEVTHKDTTAVVSLCQDWDTSRYFPQASWKEAWLWLKAKAPTTTFKAFEALCKKDFPAHAQRWDEEATATAEFSFEATTEEMAAIAAAAEETQKLLAEFEEEKASREALKEAREKAAELAAELAAQKAAQAEEAKFSGLGNAFAQLGL